MVSEGSRIHHGEKAIMNYLPESLEKEHLNNLCRISYLWAELDCLFEGRPLFFIFGGNPYTY